MYYLPTKPSHIRNGKNYNLLLKNSQSPIGYNKFI